MDDQLEPEEEKPARPPGPREDAVTDQDEPRSKGAGIED